jgi:hypothetical protein
MSSVLYDAVLVAGGRDSVDTLAGNGDAVHYVAEAFKHARPIAAPGRGHRPGAPRLTAGCAAGRRTATMRS